MIGTSRVTPPERQQLATVHTLPAARPAAGVSRPIGVRQSSPRRVPQAPTYDAQILNDGLNAAKEIVRILQHHLTEAELHPGRPPADPRQRQTRVQAVRLARSVAALRNPKPL